MKADMSDDIEVRFYWNLASSDMEGEEGEKLLEAILTKWITVRGHSFSKSVLELYKQGAKKGTEKARPLRATV